MYFKIAGSVSAIYTGGIITTTVRDEKKLEFVKKYPLQSIGLGLLGVSVAGICFPYTFQSLEKHVYLFGGFPFNGLLINRKKDISDDPEYDYMYVKKHHTLYFKDETSDKWLQHMVDDYEKAFPEMKNKGTE